MTIIWTIQQLRSLLMEFLTLPIAQALLSLALVIATGFYTYEASQQTEQMKTERRDRIKPIIRPTIEPRGVSHHTLALVNSGEGAAYDVDAEWQIEDDDTIKWKSPLLTSGERRRFDLPTEGDSTVGNLQDEYGEEARLHFEVEYEDGDGRRYTAEENPEETTQTIKLSDIMASKQGAQQFLEKDPLSGIQSELSDLNDTLDTAPPRGEVEAKVRITEIEAITSIVKEEGPMTFSRLQSLTGFEPSRLSRRLRHLRNLSFVEFDEEARFESEGGQQTEISAGKYL